MRNTIAMRAAGIQHLIDRVHRESPRYQWVRETLFNGLEAGATRVQFGVEWQAVERLGVYRLTIADDGAGMDAKQLVEFFSTFGGGGKQIGGPHQNFGVGAKTSLLPWNQHGIAVVSWVGGRANMIWMRRDPKSGEYGLKVFNAVETIDGQDTVRRDAVLPPFEDPESGCNWAEVKPSWIGDHGTVVVLLGNKPTQDTITGDPSRGEEGLKAIARYLNHRVWQIPTGVSVSAIEMRSNSRADWPKAAAEARGASPLASRRTIVGARGSIESPRARGGKLGATGALQLTDGTLAHWFLWEGERPDIHGYAPQQGFISALYRNELYDLAAHVASYRSFGVTAPEVRARLWLVLEPKPWDEASGRGAYPRTDRGALLLGDGGEGRALPWADWGAEFADRMPDAVKDALRAAQAATITLDDPTWKDRLAAQFGARWTVTRLRPAPGPGAVAGGEGAIIRLPVSRGEPGEPGEAADTVPKPSKPGGVGEGPARPGRVRVGIPSYRRALPEELEPGMLAGWSPHEIDHPEGVVLLNTEHPVLREQIRHWQAQFASHLADEVEREVVDVYGQVAVAKVAHSDRLRGILDGVTIERELRSETALTMALLGLIAEESLLSRRLALKFGRKREAQQHAV